MVYLLFNRTFAILGCLTLILSVWSTAAGAVASTAAGSEPWDPTKPSSEIESRLATEYPVTTQHEKPTRSATSRVTPYPLQMRGMVMRDSDHGTAFVSIGDSRAQLVQLRRTMPGRPGNLITLGGVSLLVADFNETQIVLQTVDGLRQYVIQ